MSGRPFKSARRVCRTLTYERHLESANEEGEAGLALQGRRSLSGSAWNMLISVEQKALLHRFDRNHFHVPVFFPGSLGGFLLSEEGAERIGFMNQLVRLAFEFISDPEGDS
jgi:hypothetical protein